MALPLVIAPGSLGHISHHEEIDSYLQVPATFGVPFFKQGTYGARPAAAAQGRFYYATDANVLYWDSGAGWIAIQPGIQSARAASSVDLTLTTAYQPCPSCTVTITTQTPNAIYKAWVVADLSIAVQGTGALVARLNVDAAGQSGAVALQDYGPAGARETGAQVYRGTLVAAGSHTFLVEALKGLSGGTGAALANNTTLLVEVIQTG